MKMEGLAKIRKERGYSQLKVAFALNISREALSYYENGKRNPDLDMLMRMSEYFDVSIHFLVTGNEFTPRLPHISHAEPESAPCKQNM